MLDIIYIKPMVDPIVVLCDKVNMLLWRKELWVIRYESSEASLPSSHRR